MPYDRPKLSKAMGVRKYGLCKSQCDLFIKPCHKVKPEEVALRRAEWYQRAGVELVRGVEAVSLLPGKVGDEDKLAHLYFFLNCHLYLYLSYL